jgi:ABC-type glutathione transport system ATPase component
VLRPRTECRQLPPCSPTRALLEVRDLSVFYGAEGYAPIFSGLSFEIETGEVLGLQGRSGCGKTSTALAILGLLPSGARVSGSVLLRGNSLRDHDLLKAPSRELRRIRGKQISIIYQEPVLALNPVMRVGDQIAEILRAHTSSSSRQCRERAHQMLDNVSLDSARFYRSYPHELSGGERHRVVLAQALVCQPSLVIADEPTAGLDQVVKMEILDVIAGMRREFGTAFLLISHDRSVCSRVADRIIEVPSYGQISGRTRVDTRHAASAVRSRRRFLHVQSTAPTEEARSTAPEIAPSAGCSDTAAISIRGLSKWYRSRGVFSSKDAEKHALDCIDLNIPTGSILALVGPSGSGKSTLARCMSLLESAEAGEIFFQGTNLLGLSRRELRRYRPRFQYIAQDPAAALNPRLSAAETIAEPMLIQGSGDASERRLRVEELMRHVGLDPEAAHRSCQQFSGGQKQRLAIARALALKPKLLIFDESLSGLDVETQKGIADLLKQLKQTLGITQLLISHDLEFVASIADQVAVMRNGRIVERTNNRVLDERWSTRQLIDSAPRRELVSQEIE